MTDSEIVALIFLWGRIAPDEKNAWDWRCDEQAWMSKQMGWCEEEWEEQKTYGQQIHETWEDRRDSY